MVTSERFNPFRKYYTTKTRHCIVWEDWLCWHCTVRCYSLITIWWPLYYIVLYCIVLYCIASSYWEESIGSPVSERDVTGSVWLLVSVTVTVVETASQHPPPPPPPTWSCCCTWWWPGPGASPGTMTVQWDEPRTCGAPHYCTPTGSTWEMFP